MFGFLKSSSYHPLNKIQISHSALDQNYQALQAFHPEAQIAPVLKSNAYGHGLMTVAPTFDQLGAPFLIVDSLYEAYELHKLQVKTPILILGYTHPDNFKVKQLPFHVTVFDWETIETLSRYQAGCSIHLFVDTGMHREGVQVAELPHVLKKLQQLANLKVVGLASHLADADNPTSDTFTKVQIKSFETTLQMMRDAGFDPRWRHLSASAGAFKLIHPACNLIRMGIASYGIHPLEASDAALRNIKLQPALRFVSTLAQIKEINKGDKVGYNVTFTARKSLTLGLIPAGYNEGVDRRLSNQGNMTIRGMTCPIVGRVSMNMTMIDISQVKNPEVGEEVVIYDSDNNTPNSLVKVAQTAGTIPYELLVHLSPTVKREMVK